MVPLAVSCVLAREEGEIPKGIIAQFPSILKAKPLEPVREDDELKSLMKLRYNAAVDVTREHWVKWWRAGSGCGTLLGCARRVMQAGMDLKDNPKEKLEVALALLEFSEKLEAAVRSKGPMGVGIDQLDIKEVLEFRVEVNIARTKLQQSLKPPDKGR